MAASADELGRLRYAAYVDGGIRTFLEDASCEPVRGPAGFPCSALLPGLSPGRHTLELVAVSQPAAEATESARSMPLSIVVVAAARPQSTASPRPPGQPGPSRVVHTLTAEDGTRLVVEVFASRLDSPVAMAFSPDGDLFVAERNSQIRRVGKRRVSEPPALTLGDVLDPGEVGSFVDLAFHPAFAQNNLIYVLYVAQVPGAVPSYRLARFRELNGVLAERAVLLDGILAGPPPNRATVRFGPDRRLYIGVEDLAPQSVAQDLGSMNGKILRVNDDGTVPRDNPRSSPVFSYGHRAPAGLAWHPETGDLWETERGLNGQDELNLVTRNADFGWPDAQRLEPRSAGHVQVALESCTAPVGATFYSGSAINGFRNNLFLSSLAYRSLCRVRFDPSNPRRVVAIERLLEDRFGNLGPVVNGPDGALYFFSTNRATASHADPDDDRILRMAPAS